MPSDLDKRIATQPPHEVSQRIISRKLFPHSMDPSAPFPPQHRCNLATGEQPDLVAVDILDRQELVGLASKTKFFECWAFIGLIAGTWGRAGLEGPEIRQQAIDRLRDLLRIQWLQKIIHRLEPEGV